MTNIIETLFVKLDANQDDIVALKVVFSEEEQWIVVEHNGSEISLSLNNWNCLVSLVEKAKSRSSKF